MSLEKQREMGRLNCILTCRTRVLLARCGYEIVDKSSGDVLRKAIPSASSLRLKMRCPMVNELVEWDASYAIPDTSRNVQKSGKSWLCLMASNDCLSMGLPKCNEMHQCPDTESGGLGSELETIIS